MARRKRNDLRKVIFGDEDSLFDLSDDGSSKSMREPIQQERIFTVSELTALVRSVLQNHLPERILVSGEISNLSQPDSGHIYFTLKDEYAQINCVIWRSVASKIKFSLEDGLAVIAGGSVDIYAPRGQYQLYVDMLKPAGIGELELAFRQLKEKLEKQGLFDSARKKPIPQYPFTIAVITSATGAAIRDIVRTLNLRWPIGKVLIYPVQVQGENAKYEIAQAIKDLNIYADDLNIDLIILARGGGSLEDLWAFNEEIVARAIYESELPIITGVGHEIDITIADLVADLRAATPTAAAQLATPKLTDILAKLDKYFARINNVIAKKYSSEARHLLMLANRPMFRNPVMLLAGYVQRLDESAQNLQKIIAEKIAESRNTIHSKELKFNRVSPQILLMRSQHRLENLGKSLSSALDLLYKTNSTKIDHFQKRLDNCDYRRVLKRGFAIVRKADDGKLLTSVSQAQINEEIATELSDGFIKSRIEETNANRAEK